MRLTARRWPAALMAGAMLLAACTDSGDNALSEGDPTPESTSPASPAGDGGGAERPTVEIDETPIEIDGVVRTGILDNGLTYYARSNDAPGGQLQLRLVVRAGSMQETDAGSGLAHFTEHMLFNGTEAYPRNNLNDVLRRFGSEFGADLNAYTSREETVYILSVPRTDDEAVAEAFDILDEWAERALLTEQDTIEERGVVREEFRARAESVDGVIFDVFDDIYSAGSRYEDRGPIGTEEAIEATTATQVRTFYDRWYRPDLMAVVAVGDLPAERLEDEIVSRFADNVDNGDGQEHEPVTAPPLTDIVVDVVAHPDGPDPFVSLDYSIPNWPEGTVGGERLLLLDEVVAALVQQRLDDGAARGSLPIVRPFAGIFSHARSRRFLGFNFVSEVEEEGLAAVIGELKSMELDGFTDDEVARVIEDLAAAVDQMRDSADSRQDAEFAGDYV
ncbi:MAG: pitrilysin family protein, partial [Actinomycetota bacterium]|nr:pitrilysin family protein [Actinomycetota bacterium]